MTETFETALAARVDAMTDACIRCGKCVEVCPVTGPGRVDAAPRSVIDGIIEILRTGEGPQPARNWANACLLSGECIQACDYGVNPRFLLGMARLAMTRRKEEPTQQRRQGVEGFRKVARDVTHISRLQLDETLLARLGQKADHQSETPDAPDFVFYTGCNVLKTPHIALLALDIMDTLGISYQVMG
ncbi:MAG: (Fe-S)-binding protein, partial [Xanthobacteraceae bacterium]